MNQIGTKIKSTKLGMAYEHIPESDKSRMRYFALRCILSAAVCFAATFGRLAGFESYINVACAAISGKFSAAALLGAVASCAVQNSFSKQAVQLGAMLIITALNVFFPDYSKDGEPIRLSLSTAAINLLLSCIASAITPDSYTVSMRMVNSLFCACIVYAAAFVYERVKSGEPVQVRRLTAVYLAMLYIATTATLCSSQIGMFNLGRIFACAVIPTAAVKRRAAGGAVMGALTAVSAGLCSASLASNTMLLAAAGLICSAFCSFGRIAAAAAFMLSASVALGVSGLNSDTFNMLSDIIIGSAIFAAAPTRFFSAYLPKFIISAGSADCAGQSASARLSFAAASISDIRQKLALASDTAAARAENLTLTERIVRNACGGCRLYEECLANGCAKRLETACLKNSENPEIVGCIRSAELAEIIKRCRDEQLDERAEALRLREMRFFLRENLGSVTDVLNDMSCRLSRRREIDPSLSASAKGYFERLGYKGVRACVYTDENAAVRAEIYLNGSFEKEVLSVTAGLCRTLECDFELPGVTSADSITKLEFDEAAPFTADYGSFCALGSSASCSGDTLEATGCSAGEQYVLLSDGMGSGKRARLDSAMAVNLAAHMLQSGLSMTTVQRIINSVMRVKDWEESFATLDFLRLDLFSGRAEFLKSGAAPAYLCRDGAMIKIDCTSYPAGILPVCEPDIYAVKLFDGDLLILASDGAPETALLNAAEISYSHPTLDAKRLAYEIGRMCTENAGEKPDDITVAAVKISHRNKRKCV